MAIYFHAQQQRATGHGPSLLFTVLLTLSILFRKHNRRTKTRDLWCREFCHAWQHSADWGCQINN